jgi:hypothetical protein
MRDQTVHGIVSVIPVLIIIVSILLPFSANGWDIGATVLPANPFSMAGGGLVPGIGAGGNIGDQAPMFTVEGSGLSEGGTRFYLDVGLRNPLPTELEVKEFSATLPVGTSFTALALREPITIPSGGSAVARLEGPRPQGLISPGSAVPSVSSLGELKMTISAGGMDMTLDQDAIREMLS